VQTSPDIVRPVTEQLAADAPAADAPSAELDAASGQQVTTQSRYQRWRQRRIARWDRPPDPHDWRFFVGGLGRILIVTGLLMFGFVAYQLWGTGIETARAQSDLEQQFDELLSANAMSTTGSPATVVPADLAAATSAPTTLAPAPTPTTQPAAGTEPPAASAPASEPATATPVTAPPTSPPATSPPATAPSASRLPPVERGQVLFRLEIPRLGKTGSDALYVLPGVNLTDLKKGPGHYPDTPLPGQLGNASVAGHRTTWGEPFRHVDQLVPGDELIVTMLDGQQYVYLVTGTEIVSPADYHVVMTQDPDVAMLTLTSCHPVFTSKERIAIHAVLDPSRSGVVTPPTFYELEPDPEPAVTTDASAEASEQDPVIDGSEALPEQQPTVIVTTPEGSPVTTPEGVPVTAPAPAAGGDDGAPVTRAAPEQTEIDDAFAQGWFHDKAAFPQIALWAAALTIIAFAAYRIARHFRRLWVAYAVGAIPFVVSLYFFYQNVNRLLPPGL
jgi:sortase A